MEETTAILISQYRWSLPKNAFKSSAVATSSVWWAAEGRESMATAPTGGEQGSRDGTGTCLQVMGRSRRNRLGAGSIPARYHRSLVPAARLALG